MGNYGASTNSIRDAKYSLPNKGGSQLERSSCCFVNWYVNCPFLVDLRFHLYRFSQFHFSPNTISPTLTILIHLCLEITK